MRIKNKMKITNPDASEKERLKRESIKYKKLIKNKRRLYFKNTNKRIKVLKSNNAKEYWSILNKDDSGAKGVSKISLEIFAEHFKKLSNIQGGVNDNTDTDPRNINHSINETLNREFCVDEIVHKQTEEW